MTSELNAFSTTASHKFYHFGFTGSRKSESVDLGKFLSHIVHPKIHENLPICSKITGATDIWTD
jgi:hypothetical protein